MGQLLSQVWNSGGEMEEVTGTYHRPGEAIYLFWLVQSAELAVS